MTLDVAHTGGNGADQPGIKKRFDQGKGPAEENIVSAEPQRAMAIEAIPGLCDGNLKSRIFLC
jgi:hypothetical protein